MGTLTYSTQEVQAKLDSIDQIDAKFGTYPRPNLLDNAYFVGGGSQQGGGQFPINQRGATSYTANGYTVDRWITAGNPQSLSVLSDCLSITGATSSIYSYMGQALENPLLLVGHTLTLSVMCQGTGGVMFCLFNFTKNKVIGTREHFETSSSSYDIFKIVTQCTADDVSSGDDVRFLVYPNNLSHGGETLGIKAAKLELGDTQTLAHQENGTWVLNEVPNYQQELAKCQRHYQIYQTQSLRPTYAADCRPVMRANPAQSTITISGVTYYANSADL